MNMSISLIKKQENELALRYAKTLLLELKSYKDEEIVKALNTALDDLKTKDKDRAGCLLSALKQAFPQKIADQLRFSESN